MIVALDYQKPDRETEKAVMYYNTWIPKSQVTIVQTDSITFICIPLWLAKKSGISAYTFGPYYRTFASHNDMMNDANKRGLHPRVVEGY